MAWLEPITLRAPAVLLEPLSAAHHDELVAAVLDGELWKLWYTNIPSPDGMAAEIERRLRLQQQGQMLAFAVRECAAERIVGMTTFMNADEANRHLEIGSTWYSRSVQRSGLNTQCKLLLLTHAFEQLRCIAVEFRTHFLNRQSRRAIERLGARLDGVLRNHQFARNGTLRDTCVYSITQDEWPTVKSHLQAESLRTAASAPR
jgi:RimJ/RimL family protein N-acetyltransferase